MLIVKALLLICFSTNQSPPKMCSVYKSPHILSAGLTAVGKDCANKLKARTVCALPLRPPHNHLHLPGVYHISQSINITVHIFITFLFEYFNMQTQEQGSGKPGGVQFPAGM